MAICLTNYKIVITFANKTQKVIDVQAAQQLKLPKGAVLTLVEVATAKPPAKLVTKRLPGQLVFEIEGEGVIAQIQDTEASPAVVSLDTSFSPATQQEITGQASSSSDICPPAVVSATSQAVTAGSWGFLGAGTAGAIGGIAALLSSKTEPGPASVVARVVAGPVLAGNDLEATIYKADGVSVLGTGRIGADGSVKVSVGNYTGVVVVKVQSTGREPDYMDEATAVGKDLGSAVLYSAGVLVQEGATLFLNVNILTTLAHHFAKEGAQAGVPLDASTVVSSNTAIAKAFGLDDLTGGAIETTIAQNRADTSATANPYGKILAALSGADENLGTMEDTFGALTRSIDFDGRTATLQADALNIVIDGAKTADPTNTIELVKKLSDATDLSSSVTIDAVSVNNEINASETQGTVVSGTCVAGSSVTISIAGIPHSATVTGTTWSYTLRSADINAMGQDAETLLVTATLNGQTASASRGIFIDTRIPDAPTINALLTNDTSPVITGNATLTRDERLTVTVNGATYNVTPDRSTGAWSLDLGAVAPTSGTLGALVNGQTYPVTATVRDAAGNTSPTSTNTLAIDTTAPTLTMNVVSGGFINSAEAQSNLVLNGTSNAEDGQIVSFTLGNKTYSATVQGGNWSATVPNADLQALPQGPLTLTAEVRDKAGNLTQVNPAASVIVDTVAPAQPSVAADMRDNSDTGTSQTDNITRNTRPELQVGALPSDVASVELLVNGQRVAATYANGVLQPTSALPDGVHAISYRYVDTAGNLSAASAPLSVTIDATAPINVAITSATSGGISGTYEAGTTPSLTIAGQAVQPIILGNNGTWSYVPTPSQLTALRAMAGTQQVVLTATDTAGNTASANRTVSADDFNGPYIKESIPADGGGLANHPDGTSATLNVVFSKEVRLGTGDIKLYEVVNNVTTLVTTINVATNSSAVRIESGNDVFITLPALSVGRAYYVTFDNGTFEDLSGEDFAGLTQNNALDFTAVAASISPNFVAQDDIINTAEKGAAVLISGKVVASQAILDAIVPGDLTITVIDPSNQSSVLNITPTYNNTGEFSFTVPANFWSEGTYEYRVELEGSTGAAANISADYAFDDLQVDLTAPTMVASVQGAQDNVGTIAGDIWAASTTATSDDTSPVISGTLSAALAGDARVVVYRRDMTDPNNPGSLHKITDSEGLTPTGLSWSVTDAGLLNGRRYDYVAYVEDAAGNRSQAAPVKTIVVDTTAPTVQVTTLTFSQDSGAPGDRITNVANQTVTGTLSAPLAAGETLQASLDGGQTWMVIPSSAVNGTTLTWSGVTLPQGQGQMQFRVTDAAGNQGSAGTLGFTLDQTPPAAPSSAPDLLAASDSGGSNSDNITNNTQPRLVVGALPAGMASAQLLVNGEMVEATYDANDGTLRPAQALTHGERSFSFRWVDTAGNISAAGPALAVHIDTIAPSLRMTNIDISADSGRSDNDFVTRTAAQTITGQLSGALANGDRVEGSVNGGSTWVNVTNLINAGGQLNGTVVNLLEGNSSIQFRVVDVAGNISPISRQDYSLDLTAPEVMVRNIDISADTGISASDFITKEATQTVTGRLMDGDELQALQSGNRLWASSNGGASWQDITSTVTGDAFTWANVNLTNGASSLQFKVIDAAGNEGDVSSQNYTLDTTALAAPQTQNSAPFDLLSSAQDTGSVNTDDITQVTRPAFMVQNRPVDAVGAELLIDGRLVDATFNAQNNTLTPNLPLGDGVYQVSYRYLDAAGNASAAGSATQVTIDSRAPVNTNLITFTPATIGGTYERGTTLSLKINGVDIAPNRIVLNADSQTWSLVPTQAELTTAGTGLLNKANSTFELTATDLAGNVTLASKTVSKDVFNAPYIKEFIPGDGGILANDSTNKATLNLVFSKAVQAGAGKIKLFNEATNVLVAEIDITSDAVQIENDSDVYVTLPGLTTGVRYYVTLDAGTFVDSANQGYAGKTETGTSGWDFTGALASIAPDFVAQDDIINISESAAVVRITGKVVSSAAVLEDIVAANLSVSVSTPQNAAPVSATLQSYDPETGEFEFTVPASAWANGTYGYTVNLQGSAGDASGVNASYNFANLAVDLVAPTGITGSINSIMDNAGQTTGELLVATPFKLLESGFASINGTTRVTEMTVADLDMATLTARMGGSWIQFGREAIPAFYNTASTVYNSDQTSVSFWMQSNDGQTKAVKLQLTDTNNGIELKILDARYASGVVNTAHNWNTNSGTQAPRATSFASGGYGVAMLDISDIAGDRLTDDTTPTLRGSITRALAQDERIAIDRTDDQGNTVTITGKAGLIVDGTTWTVNDGTLADGRYTYRVFVEDAAGNRTASGTARTITVDTQGPTAVVTAAALSQDTGTSSTDRLTKVAAQTISGTLSAALASGEKLMASLDGGTTFVDISSMVSGTSFNWTGVTLREGSNAIRLQAVDAMGNRGTSWDQIFTLDTTGPAAPSAAPDLLTADDDGRSDTDNTTSLTQPRIVVGALPQGAEAIELLVNGVAVASQYDANTLSLKPSQPLAFGSHQISYRYVDAAGNSGLPSVSLGMMVEKLVVPFVPISPIDFGDTLTSQPRVYMLGDLNGDGFSEFAMGSREVRPMRIIMGGNFNPESGFLKYVDIPSNAGTAIPFAASNLVTDSIAGLGDFNGDGILDYVTGGDWGDKDLDFYMGNNSSINVTESFGGVIWSNDFDPRNIFNAGDVNGDGLTDMGIIGRNNGGVLFGRSASTDIQMTGLSSGVGGYIVSNNSLPTTRSGDGIGDANGDGRSDIGWFNSSTGSYYLEFTNFSKMTGTSNTTINNGGGIVISGFAQPDLASNFNAGNNNFTFNFLSSAGDFNGDGYADMLVSDPSWSDAKGRVAIVFGGQAAANLTPQSFTVPGQHGYLIEGIDAVGRFGLTSSSIGDVNGDGLSDVLISAPSAAGVAYVVYGRANNARIDLNEVKQGIGGFSLGGLRGNNFLGSSVSNGGDINGDGLSDFVLSSDRNFGMVVFGGSAAVSEVKVSLRGTDGADHLSDSSESQTLVAGLGNDTLTAQAASVLYGGAGNDTFEIGAAMATALQNPMGLGGNVERLARIDGGTGLDTLRLLGATDLDLTLVANQAASLLQGGSRIDSIETIDLNTTGENTLKLTVLDLIDMASANTFETTGRQQLMVKGGAGDTVQLMDTNATTSWTLAGATVTLSGAQYHVLNHNTAAATLYVQVGVAVTDFVAGPQPAPVITTPWAANQSPLTIDYSATPKTGWIAQDTYNNNDWDYSDSYRTDNDDIFAYDFSRIFWDDDLDGDLRWELKSWQIGQGDRIKGATLLGSFDGTQQITVPSTFGSVAGGDDQIDNNQFEVYYGTYTLVNGDYVFTVISTEEFENSQTQIMAGSGNNTTLAGATHTLILFDNDSQNRSSNTLNNLLSGGNHASYLPDQAYRQSYDGSEVNLSHPFWLDAAVVSGVYHEKGWTLTKDADGSNQRLAWEAQPDYISIGRLDADQNAFGAWFDTNENGVRDEGEEQIQLRLSSDPDTLVYTYTLRGVDFAAGSYTVRFVDPVMSVDPEYSSDLNKDKGMIVPETDSDWHGTLRLDEMAFRNDDVLIIDKATNSDAWTLWDVQGLNGNLDVTLASEDLVPNAPMAHLGLPIVLGDNLIFMG